MVAVADGFRFVRLAAAEPGGLGGLGLEHLRQDSAAGLGAVAERLASGAAAGAPGVLSAGNQGDTLGRPPPGGTPLQIDRHDPSN